MRYSLGMLAFGLVFSAPGWAIAIANAGEHAMWAGLGAGTLAYLPFVAASLFPGILREVVSEH